MATPIHVRIQDVCRYYVEGDRTLTVLENANCEIARGEHIALLGRSGSGKSTLLNLIAGIDVADSGRIEVGKLVVNEANEQERTLYRRHHLGFVFQAFNLVPTLTVGENVELPLSLLKVERGERIARARAILDEVGLVDRIDSFVEKLSGGERQRIAVARALVHRPELILADEPTGNLDDDNANTVLDLLGRMSRDRGTSLIMATHSMSSASRADRCLGIVGGRIDIVQPEGIVD